MATASPKTAAKRATKTAEKTVNAAADAAASNGHATFKVAEDFQAAAREQFESAMSAFSGNADEWRERSEEVIDEMRARFEKQQEIATQMNADMVAAAQDEMSDAVQFMNDLTKAKTFADALDIQREYWTSLFETRMERTREMTGASVEAARDSMTPMRTDFGAFFNTGAMEKMFRFPTKA